MSATALFWIRDGVLIDRMPVNAVAFAIASLQFAHKEAVGDSTFTDLINYAFLVSGISCAEKMEKFNNEQIRLIANVQAASDYYNKIASTAAENCKYFAGICDLLKTLQRQGAHNFITSAVDQSLLDQWSGGAQGSRVTSYLTEILGSSQGFKKGKDHFDYVRKKYNITQIYFVADAVAEIRLGAEFSEQCQLVPIGFAHLITPQKIAQAIDLVASINGNCCTEQSSWSPHASSLQLARLNLPGAEELQSMLAAAKAHHIVSGTADEIVSNLTALFRTLKLLPDKEVANV